MYQRGQYIYQQDINPYRQVPNPAPGQTDPLLQSSKRMITRQPQLLPQPMRQQMKPEGKLIQ